MNHSELIDSVATKSGLSKADANKAVDAIVEAVKDALVAKEKVTVKGLGILSVKEVEARQGRNPATGAVVEIAAKTAVKFKTAKALADAVNA